MSLPLGLYGLPLAANGAGGDEAVLGTTSNDAYAEFRRQMLSQVQAAKSKRKSANANGNSRPNSVSGNDDDNNSLHGNSVTCQAFHMHVAHYAIHYFRQWAR